MGFLVFLFYGGLLILLPHFNAADITHILSSNRARAASIITVSSLSLLSDRYAASCHITDIVRVYAHALIIFMLKTSSLI